MTFFLTGLSVKCYVGVEPEGERWVTCDLHRGMRTCYTKYDMFGETVARGCASKEKMFHEQCEVHEMDDISEKFCYCSFNWCNSSPHRKAVNLHHHILVLFLIVSINMYNSYCLEASWHWYGEREWTSNSSVKIDLLTRKPVKKFVVCKYFRVQYDG